jgi:hypothetical protein
MHWRCYLEERCDDLLEKVYNTVPTQVNSGLPFCLVTYVTEALNTLIGLLLMLNFIMRYPSYLQIHVWCQYNVCLGTQ